MHLVELARAAIGAARTYETDWARSGRSTSRPATSWTPRSRRSMTRYGPTWRDAAVADLIYLDTSALMRWALATGGSPEDRDLEAVKHSKS